MRHLQLAIPVFLCTLTTFVLLGTPAAQAESQYKVAKGSKLRIDIYHPVKHVIAHTKKLKGFIKIKSGTNGNYQLDGAITVKIRHLKSGNRRRDRVMWTHLGKSRQPYIYFYPKTLTLQGGKGTVTGEFLIKRNKKLISLKVTKTNGKFDGKSPVTLHVKGFLKCSDFKVKRPSLLFVSIKDKVDLQLTITFKPGK